MTAKEYLLQARRLDAQIDVLIKQKEDLLRMATSITAPQTGEKVKTNPSQEAPFVRTIDKVIALEERINAKIDRLVMLKAEMIDALDSVKDTDEKLILTYRYLGNVPFEDIAAIMHMSMRNVYRIHGYALRDFEIPKNSVEL